MLSIIIEQCERERKKGEWEAQLTGLPEENKWLELSSMVWQ